MIVSSNIRGYFASSHLLCCMKQRAAFEARGKVHYPDFEIIDEDTSVSPPVAVRSPDRNLYYPVFLRFPFPVSM